MKKIVVIFVLFSLFLLNTSFNVKDKTMVLTPEDALDTFYNSEMDILVLENYVIEK